MRAKILGVFAVVVTIVSALSLLLMRSSVEELSDEGAAQRAATAAVAQLQVEGLSIERWLGQQLGVDQARAPFEAGSEEARGDQATTFANEIEQRGKSASPFAAVKPIIIVLFDNKGVVLGRNQSNLMRGDKLGDRHPAMMKAIAAGVTGSELWVDKDRNEQQLVSYAAVRDAAGKVLGGVAIGTAFNNERLQNISASTSQLTLLSTVKQGDKMAVLAATAPLDDALRGAADKSGGVLGSKQVVDLAGVPDGILAAARPLRGYTGESAVVIAVSHEKASGFTPLLVPFFGVLMLGLVLTAVAAHLLDRYVSQPISDLEEGLLAVINGEHDLRFELEHDLFGGLVFRVNSLLNELLDVEEDTTDEDGRLSVAPPSARRFDADLSVDERLVALSVDDVDDGHELRDQDAGEYYQSLFNDYIAATEALDEPTAHIRFTDFSNRIKASEREVSDKHSKPFRYRVEAKGREILLIAVPLA